MLYICAKFHEIILNGIKVIERTRFLYGKLQRGIAPQKCRWSDSCLSLHIIWSCFTFLPSFVKLSQTVSSYRADTISKLKITMGNNSAKNVGGVTIVNRCTSSGHTLYFYQVL